MNHRPTLSDRLKRIALTWDEPDSTATLSPLIKPNYIPEPMKTKPTAPRPVQHVASKSAAKPLAKAVKPTASPKNAPAKPAATPSEGPNLRQTSRIQTYLDNGGSGKGIGVTVNSFWNAFQLAKKSKPEVIVNLTAFFESLAVAKN